MVTGQFTLFCRHVRRSGLGPAPREPAALGPLPWQADVLMMPFDQVDWDEFRMLAHRFTPALESADVVGRLMELRRDWQLPVPEIAPARAPRVRSIGRTAS